MSPRADINNENLASLGVFLGVEMTASPRLSVEDHFQRRGERSDSGWPLGNWSMASKELPQIPPQDEPPSYDEFLSTSLRRKFNIQPREDEGQEILPPYSCALCLENVFLRKTELHGAIHRAHDRNWYREVVSLQGTALTFSKYKGGNVFKDGKNDIPVGNKKGGLLRSYNLQHAEVGVAADYLKKRFVIRIRAEADQFLIACNTIETFVLWLQSLFAAIDLAAPLDDRDLPRDLSIPRPRRRRADRAADRTVNELREQQELIARDYPNLATASTSSSSLVSDLDDTESVDVQLVTPALLNIRPPSPAPSEPRVRPSLLSVASRSRLFQQHGPAVPYNSTSNSRANSRSNSGNSSFSRSANPSLTESGKWRPQHQWTPFYDMLYAKRCMAILTSRSPRKSNLVIIKGKRWVVDWSTGRLKAWRPGMEDGLPDYDENDWTEEEWMIGQLGELIPI